MSARDEVLARIALAHRAAAPEELAYEGILRTYSTGSDLDREALTERLVDRLVDYKALVRRCRADDLPAVVAAALTERGADTVVVPPGLDDGLVSGVRDKIIIDDGLDVDQLDATDGVLTTCTVAVAETGTLILDGSAGMGRRVISLIPDYHLCVVRPEQICADVPQAISRLDATRPITMISGPSATSDIELNRVEGVHGPRTLEVIIVEATV